MPSPARRLAPLRLAPLLLASTLLAAACGGAPGTTPAPSPSAPPAETPLALEWTFTDASHGFAADGTDFDPATRGEVTATLEAVPGSDAERGLRVVADNRSDDLWHFLWRELGPADGIVAGTSYTATITLRVASNVASGCMGVGGSPDAVTLKGGVVDVVPGPVAQADGYIGFSADKGNQVQIGPEAVDLGMIGTAGTDCEGSGNPWEVLERTGTMTATATDDGRLWVYVGGDSGFESTTTLYYLSVGVTLDPE